MGTRMLRLVALLAAMLLLAAACGDVSDDLSGDEATDEATTEEEAEEEPATEEPTAEETETADEGGGAVDDGVVDIGLTLEPPTLDFTANSAAAIPEVVLYNVMETLVEIGADGEILPLLAEDWERSDDGTQYTFHLVEATFHDGTPLTADDVVFSFERAMDPETAHPFATNFEVVESVTAVDDRTVEVTLSRNSNDWLFNMGRSPGIIYSEEHVDSLAEAPIGTGPFRIDQWVRGDRIELVRNDDYWGEAPAAERVAYRYIEDPNALTNAMLSGELDVIARVTAPELMSQFEEDDSFQVLEGLSDGEVIFTLNNAAPPLDDVRVRQAITHAIDRAGVRNTTYAGYGALIGSHVPPQDPWYIDLTDTYPYDPDRARQLLEEAGYGDGLTLTAKLPPPPYARRGGEVIAGQLAEVGITLNLENVEWAQWLEEVFGESNFETTIVAHVEPRDIFQFGNPDYYWNYDNPEVADLIDQADGAPDEADRDAAYQQVQTIIAEDAVVVWLYLLPELAVIKDGIGGYNPDRLAGSINVTDLEL